MIEVPIADAVNVHFRDIGHDPEDHSVTYENCQARERTQVLMDIANKTWGMVIGTGDLSELALDGQLTMEIICPCTGECFCTEDTGSPSCKICCG